ncbi:MAG: T9SS C-terminal target domain-containing protein [Calditrichaeota bacterium]|nr:MAG: T9SS C-terminal target domain-containing protein [Calditrichota bacterium]
MKKSLYFVLLFITSGLFCSQQLSTAITENGSQKSAVSDTLFHLNIPPRPEKATGGNRMATRLASQSLNNREKAIIHEIRNGNVPSFARKLRSIKINQDIGTKSYELELFALCDYLAIGSDEDYLYTPMTPSAAQFIADELNCTLPTSRLVSTIYNAAELKLRPQPIPPSNRMTTVPVFRDHTDSIKQQIISLGFDRSSDSIIGGNKKDVIISNKIYSTDRNYDRVVIYGWHRGVNDPIQPVYNGHNAQYADYSHGVRLIANLAFLNGDSVYVTELMQDARLSALVSSEGKITIPYYPANGVFTGLRTPEIGNELDFQLHQNFPNPFNPTTIIYYQLAKAMPVDLSVYNLLGQKIATLVAKPQTAGDYQVAWNAFDFPSGMYVYKLRTGALEEKRTMLLVR